MQGSLFLTPQNVQDCCDLNVLQKLLLELKVIAEPIQQENLYRSYQAGENFAQHVIYAGCSPHLRFSPESIGDLKFCHIALHGPFDQALIQTGQNTVKPRCPACRGRLADWAKRINKSAMPCAHCGQVLDAVELDWRQQAAVGRLFLEIRNVFPSEANPSDTLMKQLGLSTGFAWVYAWAGMRPFENV